VDDADFLRGFEAGTLPSFRHQDHRRMAWLYLRRDGPVEGEARIMEGPAPLRRDERCAGPLPRDVDPWVRRVRHVDEACRAAGFDDLLTCFPRLADKDLPLLHYRRETLFGAAARQGWVEPDLRQLP
jgi:hypothetical protein